MQTAERRQQLREALIQAAERRIEEQGLAGLRARDLAREVGCALGAIYNVFPDLNALILEVNARTLAAIEAFIAQAEPARGKERLRDLPSAVADLVALATAYLDFAAAHTLRWRALFEHRMPEAKLAPEWYLKEQMRLFAHIEGPLHDIRPQVSGVDRALLARSLFSAVHGIVSLGLDRKLSALPLPILRKQTEQVAAALGLGLMAG